MVDSTDFLGKVDNWVTVDKIAVSVPWLARELNVNVNDAKLLLETYSNSSSGKKLSKTYFVSGVPSSSDSSVVGDVNSASSVAPYTVGIVSEKSYSSYTSTFQFISSSYLYSIQLDECSDPESRNVNDPFNLVTNTTNSQLSNIGVTNEVNVESVRKNLSASIRNPVISYSPRSTVQIRPAGQSGFSTKPSSSSVPSIAPAQKATPSTASSDVKKTDPTVKKGGFASFFNASPASSSSTSAPTDPAPSASADSGKKSSIASFFSAKAAPKAEKASAKLPKKRGVVESDDEGDPSFNHAAFSAGSEFENVRAGIVANKVGKAPLGADKNADSDLFSKEEEFDSSQKVSSDQTEKAQTESKKAEEGSSKTKKPRTVNITGKKAQQSFLEANNLVDSDVAQKKILADSLKNGTRKLVKRTRVNDKGYLVTEEVYVDAEEAGAIEAESAKVLSRDVNVDAMWAAERAAQSPNTTSGSSAPSGKPMSFKNFFNRK